MTKDNNQTPKKTEFLEVRVPHENKQAFMKVCKENGATASGVLREAISLYLENGHLTPEEKPDRRLIMLATGFIAGAITVGGLTALYSSTDTNEHPLIAAYFNTLDSNNDNRVTMNEYLSAVKPTVRTTKYKYIIGSYMFYSSDFNQATEKDFKKIPRENGLYDLQSTRQIDEANCNVLELATAQQGLLFNKLDVDGDDALSKAELLASPAIATEAELQSEFRLFDRDNDQNISTAEFKAVFTAIRENGFIIDTAPLYSFEYPGTCWHPEAVGKSRVDLMKVASLAQHTNTDEEADYLFEVADKNSDKSITYKEYLNYFIPKE